MTSLINDQKLRTLTDEGLRTRCVASGGHRGHCPPDFYFCPPPPPDLFLALPLYFFLEVSIALTVKIVVILRVPYPYPDIDSI